MELCLRRWADAVVSAVAGRVAAAGVAVAAHAGLGVPEREGLLEARAGQVPGLAAGVPRRGAAAPRQATGAAVGQEQVGLPQLPEQAEQAEQAAAHTVPAEAVEVGAGED